MVYREINYWNISFSEMVMKDTEVKKKKKTMWMGAGILVTLHTFNICNKVCTSLTYQVCDYNIRFFTFPQNKRQVQ